MVESSRYRKSIWGVRSMKSSTLTACQERVSADFRALWQLVAETAVPSLALALGCILTAPAARRPSRLLVEALDIAVKNKLALTRTCAYF
jgi:hypothetical protein